MLFSSGKDPQPDNSRLLVSKSRHVSLLADVSSTCLNAFKLPATIGTTSPQHGVNHLIIPSLLELIDFFIRKSSLF